MSLASRFLIALAGLGLIWFFWPFGRSNEVVTIAEPPPTGHDGRLFTKPAPPKATEALAEAETTGEVGGEKVAAIAPKAIQEPKLTLKPKLFYRVVVRDGGTLQAGRSAIKLYGITAREADATCKDSKGRSWACGARARAALTRLIRGRAVSCDVPVSGKHTALTTRCFVGRTDLSIWMVTQGWAEPKAPAEAKLAEAADEARKKKIGLWR